MVILVILAPLSVKPSQNYVLSRHLSQETIHFIPDGGPLREVLLHNQACLQVQSLE